MNPHIALMKKKSGDSTILVTESDRSANHTIIKNDIMDTAILVQIFEKKYEEVWKLAESTWHDRVEEYNKIKDSLQEEQQIEYYHLFSHYKKEVMSTLQLIAYKYTLYHDRWEELIHFPDYEKDNYNDIDESMTDEEAVEVLIGRGHIEEESFKNLLNQIANTFNQIASTAHICKDLGVKPRYYPINLTRKLRIKEILNPSKVNLIIGPLKKRERALEKFKPVNSEPVIRNRALLDTLRASILCKDPIVPLIIIEHLRNTGKLTRVKNKMQPNESYKCMHVNFCLGNTPRTIYELQIIFDEYYYRQKKYQN